MNARLRNILSVLLLLLVAIPTFAGTPYSTLVGNPPVCTSLAFKSWMERLLAARQAETPLARTTTYYVAANGSSGNSGLDVAHPKQTIAQANTIIAGGNDRAVLLRRGDTWRESVGLVIGTNNITIGDYSDGTAGHMIGDAKPLLDKFQAPYVGGWSLTSGKTYTYQHAETGAVEQLREAYDTETCYIRASSIVTVEATEASYWHDAVNNLLYVHPRSNRDATAGNASYQTVLSNEVIGVSVTGDNVRIESIRIDGYGVKASTEGNVHWNLVFAPAAATNACLLKGVECYYGSFHNIGSAGTAGIFTLIDCRAGWGVSTTTGYPVVGYAAAGGHEFFCYNVEIVGGERRRLSPENYYDGTGFIGQGIGIYGHTITGNPALTVLWRCRNRPGSHQVGVQNTIANGPAFTDLKDCRVFIVDDVFNIRERNAADMANDGGAVSYSGPTVADPDAAQGPPYKYVRINNRVTARILAYLNRTDAPSMFGALSGLWINSTFLFDFDSANLTDITNIGYVQQAGGRGNYYNCLFRFEAKGSMSFALAYLNALTDGGDVSWIPSTVARNCIFSAALRGTGATFITGLKNNAANISNNAYHGVTGKTLTNAGYSADPYPVELGEYVPGPPPADSALVSDHPQTVLGYRLEYGDGWDARGAARNAIGPWEYTKSTFSNGAGSSHIGF